MSDMAVEAIGALVPGGAKQGELIVDPQDGRRLRWIEVGAGRSTVVLEAGLATPGLTWAPILVALAPQCRVVAYDRAGVGASDPTGELTLASQVADAAALIRCLDTGPCILVGHSWGGLLVQLVAWEHPDLVAGLVLVDPTHEETVASLPWPARTAQTVIERSVQVFQKVGLLRRLVRRHVTASAQSATDDPHIQALLTAAWVDTYTGMQVRMTRTERKAAERSIVNIRQRRRVAQFPPVPVTVLSATRGLPKGIRGPWTALQGQVADAAGGDHLVVTGAGHYIHESHPQVVSGAILSHVAASNGPI